MGSEIDYKLRKIIEYLGKIRYPVDEERMIEDLRISREDLNTYLTQGIDEGIINVRMVVFCEECSEDVMEIEKLDEVLGKEVICEYCGEEFTVTEDNIRRYYWLTFKGLDLYAKLTRKKSLSLPSLKLLPYFVSKKSREIDRPVFNDYFFIILLHFLRDLIPFMEALEKFGANPDKCYLICKPYPYAYKDEISSYLVGKGYHLKIARSFNQMHNIISSTLNEIKYRIEREGKYFIVVEDGGYITPLLHEEFSELLPKCKGVVEQTTKGIRRDRRIRRKKVPILNVAECDFKRMYEPPFIAEAVVHNIRNMLPDKNFAGQYALVIGYGAIGRKIVSSLCNSLGMKVYVVEKSSEALLDASNDKFVVKALPPNEIKTIIGECMLIVGATGAQSIGRSEITLLKHGAILVSASSDRDEINVEELESLMGKKENKEDLLSSRDGQKVGTAYTLELLNSKKVLLLADGYPINFYYSESVPNESFDPILTLLFLTILELAIRQKIRKGINTKLVNNLVRREKIIEETLRFYRSIIV